MTRWTIGMTTSGIVMASSGTISALSGASSGSVYADTSGGLIYINPFSIELPVNPNNVSDKTQALSLPMPIPMGLPFIFSYGIENRSLTVQGAIFSAGKTVEQIESQILLPLKYATYRVISISNAGARYNGDYILQEFSFNEVQAIVNYYTYSMTLMAFWEQVVM
jgi:hypothetical protein